MPSAFDPLRAGAPHCRGVARLRTASEGAAFVEFLIAFLPVYVFFLCLIQLALLFSVRLVTEHAAVNAARAAAVVIGDDPARYGGEKPHVLTAGRGRRFQSIRNAALSSLAPFILNGTIQNVEVSFPREEQPGGQGRAGAIAFAPMQQHAVSKVRVQLEVEAACRIGFANRIACPLLGGGVKSLLGLPTIRVRAEAIYPYQGARYEYP
jgi:hypothetical protein